MLLPRFVLLLREHHHGLFQMSNSLARFFQLDTRRRRRVFRRVPLRDQQVRVSQLFFQVAYPFRVFRRHRCRRRVRHGFDCIPIIIIIALLRRKKIALIFSRQKALQARRRFFHTVLLLFFFFLLVVVLLLVFFSSSSSRALICVCVYRVVQVVQRSARDDDDDEKRGFWITLDVLSIFKSISLR